MRKQLILLFLLGGLCLAAIGCESVKETINDTDAWMRDNLW